MTEEEILDSLRVPFRFKRRSVAIPGDLRIDWRVATLALILDYCRGKRASLKQLHVLNWSIRTAKTRATFSEILDGSRDPGLALVRFEPALNRAVDFAIGEGLAERIDGTSVGLTAKGQAFVSSLEQEDDCLAEERAFLKRIKGKTTQKKIDELFAGGS